MEISYAKRSSFITLMLLSFVCGVVFFCTNHIDFMSAAIQFKAINVSNIAYIFLQIIGCIFIPIIFLVPSIFPYGRIRLAKLLFILYGALHLLTLTWMIDFVIRNPFMELFNNKHVVTFLENGKYVYFRTFWDTNGLSTVLFTLLIGVLCLAIGMFFDHHKDLVKILSVALVATRVFIPLVHNLFSNDRIFSLYWITNNFLTLSSLVLFVVAIIIAGSNDYTWIEFVWDQTVVTEEDQPDEIETHNS